MVRECPRYALTQCGFGDHVIRSQEDRPVLIECECCWKHVTEGRNQCRVTDEVDRKVEFGVRAGGAESYRAAGAGLGGQICRLPPFEGLLDGADASGFGCRFEDELADLHQWLVCVLRERVEYVGDIGWDGRRNGCFRHA